MADILDRGDSRSHSRWLLQRIQVLEAIGTCRIGEFAMSCGEHFGIRSRGVKHCPEKSKRSPRSLKGFAASDALENEIYELRQKGKRGPQTC